MNKKRFQKLMITWSRKKGPELMNFLDEVGRGNIK